MILVEQKLCSKDEDIFVEQVNVFFSQDKKGYLCRKFNICSTDKTDICRVSKIYALRIKINKKYSLYYRGIKLFLLIWCECHDLQIRRILVEQKLCSKDEENFVEQVNIFSLKIKRLFLQISILSVEWPL